MNQWVVPQDYSEVEFLFILNPLQEYKEEYWTAPSWINRVNHKILFSAQEGPGISRNIGIREASGNWITFWDCDDLPRVDAFLSMISDAEPVHDAAVGCFRVVNQYALNQTSQVLDSNIFRFGLRMLGIWRIAFRRSFIKESTFPNLLIGEDLLFLYQLKLLKDQVYICDLVVYEYSIDTSSNTEKQIRYNEGITKLFFMLKSFLSSNQQQTALQENIRFNIVLSTIRRAKDQKLKIVATIELFSVLWERALRHRFNPRS